jgi:NAD(P)-dependent dehydrogenase (short-subunit alcohol dehydrogenase family)
MAAAVSAAPLDGTSTAQDVITKLGADLTGKNIVVTGASSGIGAEAARVFAKAGARVFALGRSESKTMTVVDAINAECGDAARVSFVSCDLSSLTSVRGAANAILAAGVPLHVLLNNAGVMAIQDRTLTADGFEMQLGTNHIGHFVLTNELIPALKAGAPSRIVNVSSKAHFRGGIIFEDMMMGSDYNPWRSYGQSKSANILHAIELQRRHGSDGITAVSLHPGVITDSDLWRHAGNVMTANKSVPQGASTSVFCALAPDVAGGAFYDNCAPCGAAPHATDPALAERLWAETEKLLA